MAKKLTRKEKIALQQKQDDVVAEKKTASPKSFQNNSLRNNLALLLGIIAFFLYANTLNHQYTLDDYSIIKENAITKKGLSGIGEIFTTTYRSGYIAYDRDLYRPLSKAMFAVEYEFWGDNPFYGHLINVLFYAFTAMLLFITLHRYWKNLLSSFVVTALFVFHPIHTEVVANIKSRDEVMCLFLFVVALYCIYDYLQTNKLIWLLGAMVSFFFSLMSKESAITFVAAFPLFIYFFTDKPLNKNITISSFMVLPAVIFMLIRSQYIQPGGAVAVADNMLTGLPVAQQKATAIYILGKYLLLHIFPHPLVSDYSFRQIVPVEFSDWKFLLSSVVFIAMLFYAYKKFKLKDEIAFGILFFFVTSSVASNIFRIIGTSFGERLMYVPSLGICVVLGALAVKYLKSEKMVTTDMTQFFKSNIKLFGVTAVVLALFSFKTITRNADWYDNLTLYETDVRLSPNSTRTHFYLGNHLSQDEYLATLDSIQKPIMLDSALAELKRSADICPTFGDSWQQIGKVLLTKALEYKKKNKTEEMNKHFRLAQDAYQKALKINPQHAMYNNNYGNVLFNMGQLAEAERCFRTAIKYNPSYAHALNNLACVYGTYGEINKGENKMDDAVKNFKDAIFYFKKAVEVDPSYITTYKFISITYNSLGDAANAQKYMQMYTAAGGK